MREVTVLLIVFAFAWSSAAPSGPVYDQRQEGGTNVHAQLENVVVLVVPPAGMGLLSLVELASKGIGAGKHEAEAPENPYRSPEYHLERHHSPAHVAQKHSHDDKLQRDPDYEQVDKHFTNLPALPAVTFDNAPEPVQGQAAPIQESTTTPSNDVVSSSSTAKPASPDDATPLFIKDAVNAHSPKLTLYSQLRSVNQPSHYKKHNRTSR